LLSIKFNHDEHAADTDALNIRKNNTQAIKVPEWVRGMTKPDDSLAAYAISEVKGNTITIQAKFRRKDPKISSAEVRAIQPPPHPPPKGFIRWLLELLEKFPWLWYFLLWLFYRGFGKNVLGMVKTTKVTFNALGLSDYVSFDLEKDWIQRRGVGIHMVNWRWQFRVKPKHSWTTFDTSKHKIYTVINVPKAPWKQQPFPDSQNPWTEMLDFACDWAATQMHTDGVAAAITHKVYHGLGLTYDMGGGASKYTLSNYFKATKFIAYLKTGAGLGNVVNCTDCATIVTAFSNLLGTDLLASRMYDTTGYDNFILNRIIAIGQSGWGCPGWGCSFGYHEVAWKGSGAHGERIYDACLKVDKDNNPWGAPGTELLPVNIPFSTMSATGIVPVAVPFTANSYRERLCKNSSDGIEICQAAGPASGTNNGRREVI
jgi:hypothetical protein